jgi:hypothetical protein
VDTENRVISKVQSNNAFSNRHENHNSHYADAQSSHQSEYQYGLTDVPKLAEQAASMYAQNPTEKDKYIEYYTKFYTENLSKVIISRYFQF